MKLGIKFLIAFLAVGLVPFTIVGVLSLYETNQILSQQSLNQLISLREVKKNAVKRYFNNVESQLLLFAEDPQIAEFMRKSRFFFTGYKTDLAVTDEALAKMREELQATYLEDFVETVNPSDGREADRLQEAFSKLDNNAIAIQYKYITENKNSLKEKVKLNRPKGDRTDYSRYHGKFHSTIRNYQKRFGCDDILLIDPDNGNIVYSMQKNIDFGTSIKDGPWAGTKLAEVLQTVIQRPVEKTILLVDYSLYLPAFDTPVGFIATPVFNKNEMIGIAVFRLSGAGIDKIMVERAGLGQTGETYLVGSDGLLRSDAKNRGVKASFKNPELNKIDTIATAATLSAKSGAVVTDDYMKRRVLCAYSSLKIHDLDWVLIAQKNVDEAFAMVDRLRFRFIFLAAGGFFTILLIVFFISRSIITPLRRLEHNAEQLSQGNLDEPIYTGGEDELGSLSRSFAYMRDAVIARMMDLRESQEQLQGIVDNSTAVIYLKDITGCYMLINRQYENVFNISKSDILGKTDYEIFPQEMADAFMANDRKVIEADSPMEMEEYAPHDDEVHTYISIKFPLHDASGNILSVCGISTDITERKKAEVLLQNYNENLQRDVEQRTTELAEINLQLKKEVAEHEKAKKAADASNRAKSEFLANMSHELRTPLNAILGFSELMTRDSAITGEQRGNLKTIGRSGEHLLSLINDVLEFSKIEAGRIVLHPENFDLQLLLSDLEDMFQLRAQQKRLSLDFACDSDVPQFIRADQNKLRQILINLLGNAVNYTETGGVTLSVSKREQGMGKQPSDCILHFEVVDTGRGVAQDDQSKIFDAFFQSNGQSSTQQGTGLGLPISRKFAELMGGVLTVNSQVALGSNFTFALPVEVADSADTESTESRHRVIGIEDGQPVFRLLVVEDNDNSRNLLVTLLQTVGFSVKEAVNGQEAIEIWENWQPHLIWMDIRMPVMDGYEATTYIKTAPDGKDTVIIALTASAFETDRLKVMAHGCDEFVRKPFREAVIFEMMHRHLGVQYVYEPLDEGGDSDFLREKLSEKSLIISINNVPEDVLARLEEATELCDADLIDQALEDIRCKDVKLADALSELAANFAYDEIIALLEETR